MRVQAAEERIKERAMVFGGRIEMTEVVMWQCDLKDYDTIPSNFVHCSHTYVDVRASQLSGKLHIQVSPQLTSLS